ncbi:fused response regulator/phosphatase [Kiloniella laminariae]|uniref:Fused response regulator/phosphatase n=1 Tax=Kiloniella laminariae TaxID=454162 RepID=A0ABT4LPP6_9PROT|nr:fused response regulator/phosphatase [Kiloniella laminariae]MCZ4282286.1 fused response regulator/phosphatase [Kiloniella laminariae]
MSSEKVPLEDILNRRILVVDDAKSLCVLIYSILKKAGFTNIIMAENGMEAMSTIAATPPDLIILDLMMPIMDGMEVCRLARQIEDTASIPIIIQTAMDNQGERLKAFAVGASDLITKPVYPQELVARTKLHLQNLVLAEKQERYLNRVADELAMAKDVQQNLLPSSQFLADIKSRFQVNIASVCEPSSELGGDFWRAEPLKNGSLGFYIADFSGHGVVSALNTVRLHTLMYNIDHDWDNPCAILEQINLDLCRILPTGQFATMMIGIISREENTLYYAAAASPQPIYGKWADPDSIEYLDTSGLPLGISEKASYETRKIAFSKDNFLFCYSDALTETQMKDGKYLEGDLLLEKVRSLSSASENKHLLDQVMKDFYENKGHLLKDDLTAVSFDYLD